MPVHQGQNEFVAAAEPKTVLLGGIEDLMGFRRKVVIHARQLRSEGKETV
jgi:hypothetical protein